MSASSKNSLGSTSGFSNFSDILNLLQEVDTVLEKSGHPVEDKSLLDFFSSLGSIGSGDHEKKPVSDPVPLDSDWEKTSKAIVMFLGLLKLNDSSLSELNLQQLLLYKLVALSKEHGSLTRGGKLAIKRCLGAILQADPEDGERVSNLRRDNPFKANTEAARDFSLLMSLASHHRHYRFNLAELQASQSPAASSAPKALDDKTFKQVLALYKEVFDCLMDNVGLDTGKLNKYLSNTITRLSRKQQDEIVEMNKLSLNAVTGELLESLTTPEVFVAWVSTYEKSRKRRQDELSALWSETSFASSQLDQLSAQLGRYRNFLDTCSEAYSTRTQAANSATMNFQILATDKASLNEGIIEPTWATLSAKGKASFLNELLAPHKKMAESEWQLPIGATEGWIQAAAKIHRTARSAIIEIRMDTNSKIHQNAIRKNMSQMQTGYNKGGRKVRRQCVRGARKISGGKANWQFNRIKTYEDVAVGIWRQLHRNRCIAQEALRPLGLLVKELRAQAPSQLGDASSGLPSWILKMEALRQRKHAAKSPVQQSSKMSSSSNSSSPVSRNTRISSSDDDSDSYSSDDANDSNATIEPVKASPSKEKIAQSGFTAATQTATAFLEPNSKVTDTFKALDFLPRLALLMELRLSSQAKGLPAAIKQDAMDHLFLLHQGMQLALTALIEGKQDQLAAIVPMIVMDHHSFMENMLKLEQVIANQKYSTAHSLRLLGQQTGHADAHAAYLNSFDRGALWERYPYTSQSFLSEHRAPLPDGLDIILAAVDGKLTDSQLLGFMISSYKELTAFINKQLGDNPLSTETEKTISLLLSLQKKISERQQSRSGSSSSSNVSSPSKVQRIFKQIMERLNLPNTLDWELDPRVPVKNLKMHATRLEIASQQLSQMPKADLAAWHYRQALSLHYLFEQAYLARISLSGKGEEQRGHRYQPMQRALGDRRDSALSKKTQPFQLGLSRRYPHYYRYLGDRDPRLARFVDLIQSSKEASKLDLGFSSVGSSNGSSVIKEVQKQLRTAMQILPQHLSDINRAAQSVTEH